MPVDGITGAPAIENIRVIRFFFSATKRKQYKTLDKTLCCRACQDDKTSRPADMLEPSSSFQFECKRMKQHLLAYINWLQPLRVAQFITVMIFIADCPSHCWHTDVRPAMRIVYICCRLKTHCHDFDEPFAWVICVHIVTFEIIAELVRSETAVLQKF